MFGESPPFVCLGSSDNSSNLSPSWAGMSNVFEYLEALRRFHLVNSFLKSFPTHRGATRRWSPCAAAPLEPANCSLATNHSFHQKEGSRIPKPTESRLRHPNPNSQPVTGTVPVLPAARRCRCRGGARRPARGPEAARLQLHGCGQRANLWRPNVIT